MQVNLDFSRPQIQETKKEQLVHARVSPELKEFIELMARVKGMGSSPLIHRYIVEGLKNDLADKFMPEPHLDKTLRELLAKF